MTTIAPAPPAPHGPPPALSSGGRTAIRVVLIAAASLLLVAALTTLSALAWGVSTIRVVADRQNLPAAMRTLTIDTGALPVALRITTDRNTREPSADLRAVNSFGGGDHRLVVTDDADAARIGIEGEPSSYLPWARGAELTVSLPPELSRRLAVTTRQEAGVLLTQADLDELDARTTHGPILLSGDARRIEAHSQHGGIRTREAISVTESFRATAGEGDVVVDFEDAAPPTVEATTRQGGVVLGLPGSGPYLVNTRSGGSSTVRVPETTRAEDAVAEVTARSDDGNVVVEQWR